MSFGQAAQTVQFASFLASQRTRLVRRTDLQTFKTGDASDSFHSYDPREKVRNIILRNGQ